LTRSIKILASLLAAAAVPAGFAFGQNVAAAEWTVVPESSAVTMYATKQGMWIAGVFGEFSARIDFDPKNPASGRIIGVVATVSVDTQDAQNNAYVHGYLNVEEFPESRFESTTIEATADGFRATGQLDLSGHTNPVALDFTFKTGGQTSTGSERAKLSGTMTINRFDFDIASDIDVNTAGQDVIVQVELDLDLEP
jgi:polyisoprenoid-binding protein YceI